MELGNTEAIKTLVAAGVGVGILPLERKKGILVYGRTQVRHLQPVLMRELAIVRRRDKPLETALKSCTRRCSRSRSVDGRPT